MPAGRDQRRQADFLEALKGLWDIGAGTLKGGVQSTLGAPGDVEDLVRSLRGSSSPRLLPTTEEVSGMLPSTGSDTATAETLGETFNPVTPAKKALLVAKGAPAVVGAAKAGLYANALRKDLLMSHDAEGARLIGHEGKLPAELYNLSLGITKEKPMSFGGDTLLVPQYGAFDPKTTPTSIHAFDAYTPRYDTAGGKRADAYQTLTQSVRRLKSALEENPSSEYLQELHAEESGRLAQAARQRLIDRHVSRFPKGGQMQELHGRGGVAELEDLPQYGKGGYAGQVGSPLKNEDMYTSVEALDTPQMTSYGHRFPTFQAYETNPSGARRLDVGPSSADVYDRIDQFFKRNYGRIRDKTSVNVGELGEIDLQDSPQTMKVLKTLASGEFPKGHQDDVILQRKAQNLIKDLRSTRSDYGEVKAWGPVGLHNENFAGIITTPALYNKSPEAFDALQRSAALRGLPFEMGPNPSSDVGKAKRFEIAKQMQDLMK